MCDVADDIVVSTVLERRLVLTREAVMVSKSSKAVQMSSWVGVGRVENSRRS